MDPIKIEFFVPHAGGFVHVEINLMNSVTGCNPGFLVSIPRQSKRPRWDEINQYMIENKIFQQLPLGAEANRHAETFVSEEEITYAIHYGQPIHNPPD